MLQRSRVPSLTFPCPLSPFRAFGLTIAGLILSNAGGDSPAELAMMPNATVAAAAAGGSGVREAQSAWEPLFVPFWSVVGVMMGYALSRLP